MVLMILLVLYGYLRPYSKRASNVVDVAVLVNFLVMLLVRNDPAIVERFSVFPTSSNLSSSAEFSNCHDDQEMGPVVITAFGKILTTFYLAPLLLFVLTILITGFSAMIRRCFPETYNWWLTRRHGPKRVSWKDISSLNLSFIEEPLIGTTIVEMRETDH